MYSFTFFLNPKFFNVLIKKYDKIYIISAKKKKYILLQAPISIMIWNTASNTVTIKKIKSSKDVKLFNNLNNIIYNWENYFFSKITFKGKGYKIKRIKEKKIVKLSFGHSHPFKAVFVNSIIKKLAKYKYIIYNWDYKKLHLSIIKLIKYRIISCYTKRGLRTRRMWIKKRTGKKSQK